jgi:hypothetical protein
MQVSAKPNQLLLHSSIPFWMDTFNSTEGRHILMKTTVSRTMEKILDASYDDNFRASGAAFKEAAIQELSIIIDGIDGDWFIQNVCVLIRLMMEATSATQKQTSQRLNQCTVYKE